jgi:ribonuclease D
VDKGARFTDWARRPLTERQIEYAIGDVTHLADIFPRILQKLVKTGRGEWLDAEMEKLADPDNYRNDPTTAWRRIKAAGRNPAVLGRLKALAQWRELEAQDKDIPRGRIVRDETLADIASHPPREQADLAKVRGLSQGWKDNEIGKRLMATIAAAKPLPDNELPPRTPRGAPLGREGVLVADLLKLLLKIRSREIDVAARLLARSEELEQLAAGVRKGLPMLEGWRFDQFGRDALELVEGKLAFAVIAGKLKMTHIDDMADAISGAG